jgi:hypothetical protein
MLGDQVQDDLLGRIRTLAGIQAAQVLAVGATDSTPCHNGSVRPTSPRCGSASPTAPSRSACRDEPLSTARHLNTHGIGDASLVTAGGRNTAVAQRAEERGHDDAFVDGFEHRRLHRFIVPDVQRGCIHALRQDLVDVLAVIVAESDLPSNRNTSAPYFSLAYFLASVNCPGGIRWTDRIQRMRSSSASQQQLPAPPRLRHRQVGAELGVKPGHSLSLGHRPVGYVVCFVEVLLRRLRGRSTLPAATSMIRSMRPRPVSIGGRPMDSLSELFGSYTLFISISSKSTLATISVSGLPLSNLPLPAWISPAIVPTVRLEASE